MPHFWPNRLRVPVTDRHSVGVMRRAWLPVPVEFLCLASAALAAPAAQAVPAPAAGGDSAARATGLSADEFEHRLFTRINNRRDRQGCRAFRLNSALGIAAARHTARMADQRELSHRLSGEADLASRITAAGYRNWRMLAENLAWGQASPRAVLRAWVRSPGHRANLDNCRLRDIGIGVEIRSGRPWVTADFGRHRR